MLIASYPTYIDPLRPATPGQQHSVQRSSFPAHVPPRSTPPAPAVSASQKPREGSTAAASSSERLLAAQLSYLASQHHASDYNKLKFGSQGSPVAYVPLSIHLPAQVRSLKARQAIDSKEKAWWFCNRQHEGNSAVNAQLQPIRELDVKPENGIQRLTVADVASQSLQPTPVIPTYSSIEEEISAAMSSKIPTTFCPSSAHITKTSQSHPINVSILIPTEHLPTIASQMTLATHPSPTVFNLPPICHLDRILFGQSCRSFDHFFGSAISVQAVRNIYETTNSFHSRLPIITWEESVESSGELLRNALHANLPSLTIGRNTQTHSAQSFQDDTSPTVLSSGPQSPCYYMVSQVSPQGGWPTNALPTSCDTALNQLTELTRNLPRQERAISAPPAMNAPKMHLHSYAKGPNEYQIEDSCPATCEPIVEDGSCFPDMFASNSITPVPMLSNSSEAPNTNNKVDAITLQQHTALGSGCAPAQGDCDHPHGLTVLAQPNQVLSSPQAQYQNGYSSEQSSMIADRRLGNLYLSSCPGKKVRLSGPVKGRGSIFRDLRTDLQRFKSLGVACIVCCLDDSELEHLGVPWSEYADIARELELDVLRIPTPEGFAPLTPSALDVHLQLLFKKYTLRGVPILAHCRGGVGRAGVIACCWLLKLGLCGWKDPDLCARTHGTGLNTSSPSHTRNSSSSDTGRSRSRVCRATIQLVERVIAVIRQRRSPKAVETYEQVRFLVDFVDYLESRARVRRDIVDMDAPAPSYGREHENGTCGEAAYLKNDKFSCP